MCGKHVIFYGWLSHDQSTPWIFGFGLLTPSTDLKGHGKYFGKFGHICQLIWLLS